MSASALSGSTTVVQLLTCFLALCSALVFVLLYLRPQWSLAPPQRKKRSHSHRHKAHRPSSLSLSSSSRSSSHSSRFQPSPRSGSPPSHPPLLIPIPIPLIPKASPSSKKASAVSSSALHSAASSVPPALPLLPHPVIVTLTTLPSRLPHIDKCLASLRAQSYPLHRLVLVLPLSLRYHVPDRLLQAPWLTILRPAEDVGALSRLSALPEDWRASSYVVCVDDDVAYHPSLVDCLVRQSRDSGDASVLGLAGYRLRPGGFVRGNTEPVRRWEEGVVDDGGDSALDDRWLDDADSPDPLDDPNPGRRGDALLRPASSGGASALYGDSPGYSAHAALAGGQGHSPAEPLAPELWPMEACDVLQSYRGVVYPPGLLPSSEALLSSLASLPSALRWTDDEFVSALLASQAVPRRVVVCPVEAVQQRLRLKEGRWSGGGVAGAVRMQRRWSEGMEALVNRGWWGTQWTVGEEEGGREGEKEVGEWAELIVEDDGADVGHHPLLTREQAEARKEEGDVRDERKEESDPSSAQSREGDPRPVTSLPLSAAAPTSAQRIHPTNA